MYDLGLSLARTHRLLTNNSAVNIDYYKRVHRNKAIGWLQEIDEEFKVNGIWSNKDIKPAFYMSISRFAKLAKACIFRFAKL